MTIPIDPWAVEAPLSCAREPVLVHGSEGLCNPPAPRIVPFDPGTASPWDRGKMVSPDAELLTRKYAPLDFSLAVQHLHFTKEEAAWLQSSEPDPEIIIEECMYYFGDMRLSFEGVRLQRAPTRAPCKLPLGPVTDYRIDYTALLALPIPAPPELTDALTWIRTSRLRDTISAHPDFKMAQQETRNHVSRHLLDDLPALHQSALFARAPWTEFSMEIPLFKVPKTGDEESRLIGDARGVNRLLPNKINMQLTNLHDLMRRLLSKHVLHQLDARSYFYHFGMSAESSEVFSIRWGGPRGAFYTSRWNVMPMGFKYAPAIANLTSKHLCRNAVLPGDELEPWVDNFLFGTDTNDRMDQLLHRFDDIRRKVNIEMKPAKEGPGQVLDAIGLRFDVSDPCIDRHFVELTPAFKTKLVEDAKRIQDTMIAREFMGVFGDCMWGNFAIGRSPLCLYTDTLNQVRTIATAIYHSGTVDSWNQPFSIPGAVQKELRSFTISLASARLTLKDLQRKPVDRDLWTDACSWAWGFVDVTPQGLAGYHETHGLKDIFLAELIAACDAWFTARNDTPRLNIDNSGAVGAMRKGHARTARGNLVLSRLVTSLPKGAQALLCTVPSKCQRADMLSRGLWAAGVPCGHTNHVLQPVAWRR